MSRSPPDRAARVERWLAACALPLWASAGVDPGKGFVERLDWSGVPDLAAPKRVRVQARQIYVFAHAKIAGLHPGGEVLALAGFDFLMRHACPEGPAAGFIHKLTREGLVIETRRDAYDHAFLLFAFAWLYRATGQPEVRAALEAVLEAIQSHFATGDGAVAVDERRLPERQQNPNMHLFEGLLAAFQATGDERYLVQANRLSRLFAERLFDRETGVLREYYDSDWRPASGDKGLVVEPGHHCEWVWLLKRHADLRGLPMPREAHILAAFAFRHGCVGDLLVDQLRPDGTVLKNDIRLWPQTEAIKAHVALAEAYGRALDPHTHRLVDQLFDRFLDRPIVGGWVDWIDSHGDPLVHAIPASSLYHLFLAMTEYLQASAPK